MTRQTLAAIAATALWLAFAAVCLGLWLSGGRGPLTRAKLRLGGLLLGLTAVSTTGTAGCTCYDMEIHDWDSSDPWNCLDGLDNDGDGWVDQDDPDCSVEDDELGLGDTQCNDGVDNDEDGLIDAQDPDCVLGLDDSEHP